MNIQQKKNKAKKSRRNWACFNKKKIVQNKEFRTIKLKWRNNKPRYYFMSKN